ncbi:MAG TPA: DEAD/DEAH box helicase [Xanthomonadales bacterium]|nr:DEAD/DEAH box helicase [Xanthomonadales bacterium]
MSFETLGLSPALLRALTEQGYAQPTPIQSQAIPLALTGGDLLAGAQTGTGKTAAFALPMLQRLFGDTRTTKPARRPRALVLTPTRELASQVNDSIRAYGKHLGVTSLTIFGGVGMFPQVQSLRRGTDVIVATPGRLIDHMDQRTVDLSGIEILVLDEADRMLDMGFIPAIRRILGALPKQRQTLLFSATFADEIKAIAAQFMQAPAEVQVAARNSVAATVVHRVHPVDEGRKKDLLLHVLAADSRRQTLVFSRTKHGADRLCRQLEQAGFRAAAIHGNKSQNARTRALSDFKSGRITILVATDIAARGLDIDQLPCVVNYDLPMVAEDYVHRIGRTGRAGADGLALSLVCRAEEHLLRDIQRVLKREVEVAVVDGFSPSQSLRTSMTADLGPRKPAHQQKQRPPKHAHRAHGHASAKPSHHAGAPTRRAPAKKRFGQR